MRGSSQGNRITMPRNHVAATLAFAFASLIAIGGHLTAATDPQPKKQTAAPAQASKPAAKATLASKKQAAKPATKPTTKAAAKRTKAAKPTIKAAKPKSPTRPLTVAAPGAGKTMPMPRPRPEANGAAPALVLASADSQPAFPRQSLAAPITTTTSANDIAAVRQALELIRKGQISALAEVKQTISDPAAVKLVDWCYLRSPYSNAGFDRYAAFTQANPSWPSVGMLQRRAEGALWEDKRDAATVRAYFASTEPKSGKGRLALARAFLAQGDQGNAQRYLREAWRRDAFTPDIEQQALDTFSGLLTTADHRARMHRMLFANDEGAAMRAARRLGPADIALAKARLALTAKAENAGALLEAVPAEARNDPNYVFGRIQWLRRTDKIAEAGQLMLSMPNNPDALHDVDEWWVERRLLARKLLDIGDAQTAYRVARDAAPPEKENSRVEHEFTAGWIALRFLQQPKTALNHFARIPESTVHPTSLARAYYWQGRALEAMGRQNEARGLYQTAAQFSAAYYGQIARGRLGISEMTVRQPPQLSQTERAALRNHDARSMLYLGRTALARGFPLEHFAFPDVGIPNVTPIGPDLDRAIVYAITRQESAFNQKTVSSANALGLMQVTPAAGRDTAKRFGAKFDQKRLLSDAVYNVQMGSAELAALLQDYRGSYILTFAGYNAGRGRIQEWLKRYGDPRNAQVDPIDWVELIPFSETRHYVQRVMENMAVYRVRLGGSNRLMIEADLRRGATAN